MSQKNLTQAMKDELEKELNHKLIWPGDDSYDQSKQLWNGAIKERPAVIVFPESAQDVQASVKWATRHQLPLSVLGGGHDWVGRALNEGGIVLNMQKLRSVHIDPDNQRAIVGGGVTGKELILAAEPHGLVAVTGTVGVVGFTGFTLGGGYGLLSPSYGLSIDNVLAADIVLADGRQVVANATENADLFWALKGGGGNFGVVISLTIRLHAAKPITSGMLLFGWDQAASILKGYSRFMETAPDSLSVLAGMISGPDGQPLLFFVPCWYGDPAAGAPYLDFLRHLGTPVMDQIAPMRCSDLLGIFDPYVVNGNHYLVETRWMSGLNEEDIAAIDNAVLNRSSLSSMINMHHFHGAATRVAPGDTAFGLRKPHFLMEIVAVWSPEDVARTALHWEWAGALSAALAKNAFSGGYTNLLGPHQQEQIGAAYGENGQRLKTVKQQYDSGHLFNGISLPV